MATRWPRRDIIIKEELEEEEEEHYDGKTRSLPWEEYEETLREPLGKYKGTLGGSPDDYERTTPRTTRGPLEKYKETLGGSPEDYLRTIRGPPREIQEDIRRITRWLWEDKLEDP